MIAALVLIGIFCALVVCLFAGFGVLPSRKPRESKTVRPMTRWSIWLLERELEVLTDEPATVQAAITARLNQSEDISSDELADMRRASEVILGESMKRLTEMTRRPTLPPTTYRSERH